MLNTRQITITAEQAASIEAEIKALSRMSKADLIEMVKRNHRVISIDKTFSKIDAISKLLETKFGRKALDARIDGRIAN